MVLAKKKPRFLLRWGAVLISLSSGLAGQAGAADKDVAQAEQRADGVQARIEKLATLESAGDFLTAEDLDAFRPGRPKEEILNELRWRAGYVLAAKCDDKNVTSINYTLYPDLRETRRNEVVHAVFVDDRFERFVRWETMREPVAAGNRRKGMKIGPDCDWLERAVTRQAASADELKQIMTLIKAPPEQIDPGLTAVYLAKRARGTLPGPPPAGEDYEKLRKNIALRDQFNAARLRVGMSEADVQAMFKAGPLESGEVEAGRYRVYGSNDAFNVSDWRYFAPFFNVLVVYRNGEAIAITSIPSGYDWRERLGRTFVDWPKEAPR